MPLTHEAGGFSVHRVQLYNATNMSHCCRHQHHYNKITIKKGGQYFLKHLIKTNDTDVSRNHIINLHGFNHLQHLQLKQINIA